MIASVFKKSKPINFVIVIGITFLASLFVYIRDVNKEFSIALLGELIILFLVTVFSIFLVNFIVVRNKLTDQSSYHILFYSVFLALLPTTLISLELLLSNVFILLALRRLISLRTQKDTKKKIFDGSLWIGVAAIFYFWSILFFALIFIALFLFANNKIKDWIISFTGLLTVLILSISYNLIMHNSLDSIINFLPELDFDLYNYNSIQLIVSITLVISFSVWCTIFYLKVIRDKLKVFKPPHKIIVAALVIALAVIIFSHDKTSGEFIYLFAPLAIITSNYIESINEEWVKDAFLIVLALSPIVVSFL
ncbi:MAG: hypothetical protein KJN66_09310 [Bacteroidia bacterium]|nr:hypothetical protein [Bacteroidia bacterium]